MGQEQRYEHVVRVTRLAERLAAHHGEDVTKARLAGMLHDLARLYRPERLVQECERRALAIDEFERANPIVLHARLAAELAHERFGIDDPAVLSAIRAHTLGSAKMSRLDEILFVADAVEPGRGYPRRAEFEALAFKNLDAAVLCVIVSTIAHLEAAGAPVAPQTLKARDIYRERSPACPT